MMETEGSANKDVVLHTDSARAYKMTLPGVIHDNVVHKKKTCGYSWKVHLDQALLHEGLQTQISEWQADHREVWHSDH